MKALAIHTDDDKENWALVDITDGQLISCGNHAVFLLESLSYLIFNVETADEVCEVLQDAIDSIKARAERES